MKRVSVPPRLPARPRDAHKSSVGRVLVVGGSADMSGAPALAGLGALRAGAGLVRIAVPKGIQATVAGYHPEAMTQGLPETRAGALGAAALPVLKATAPAWDAVVLGPGMGRQATTLGLVRSLSSIVGQPLVIDADGLFAWNERVRGLRRRRGPTVLTPHEGEAGRLLGVPSADVKQDRAKAAAAIARRSGAVVVLKGPGTLVTDGARIFENETGGPVLATGGTGDVLSGVIGALLAQGEANGLDAFQSACVAVRVHGKAADAVAKGRDRGLLASELAAGLPDAIASQRKRPR